MRLQFAALFISFLRHGLFYNINIRATSTNIMQQVGSNSSCPKTHYISYNNSLCLSKDYTYVLTTSNSFTSLPRPFSGEEMVHHLSFSAHATEIKTSIVYRLTSFPMQIMSSSTLDISLYNPTRDAFEDILIKPFVYYPIANHNIYFRINVTIFLPLVNILTPFTIIGYQQTNVINF